MNYIFYLLRIEALYRINTEKAMSFQAGHYHISGLPLSPAFFVLTISSDDQPYQQNLPNSAPAEMISSFRFSTLCRTRQRYLFSKHKFRQCNQKLTYINRLCHMFIHAGVKSIFTVFGKCIGCHCYNRNIGQFFI